MNGIEFNLILILIFINLPLISGSTSCSIFRSLNCSCFQSNVDLNRSSSSKTYSHLYCQGNSFNETTFQSPFGSDFKSQNHFRTVSIELINDNRLEILSNQFDSLAMLFSQTNSDVQIDIYLRFIGFRHIIFNKQSLTSTIFQEKHENKRLWLHLIPARSNFTESEVDDENWRNVEKQFHFSMNCFSGLILSQLTIHIYTIRDRFPSRYSFEQIFNNTNIGELHFHGAIIRPKRSSSKKMFRGVIRSLTLHRHVDTIDSNTFPFYSEVYSYTIHSIEAHSMNLSSFLFSHRNLRGLEIIKPRFEVSIDQFIPTLDSLTLDIQHLTEKTFLVARHISNLKLGSQLRTITPQVFDLLSSRLNHFDLSQIDLSQMTSDSRCYLIKYLSKHSYDHLNIIYPQMKSLNECHCVRIFLHHLQSKYYSTCSNFCHFSDCQTISEYFKTKYPLVNQLNDETNPIIDQKNEPLAGVEIFSDAKDDEMIRFLLNQEKNQIQRRPISIELRNVSTLKNIKEYHDVHILSTPKLFQSSTNPINERRSESFSWLPFFIGVTVVFVLLLLLSLLVFSIVRYRREHNFKPVAVYV